MKKLFFFLHTIIYLSVFSQTDFSIKLAKNAESLADQSVIYNPQYFTIDYPNGDIPTKYGVCTDVVIRAYRKVGIDLQKELHEDMKKNFNLYPKDWGLKYPDKNIDHRRVPNLMTFFTRFGEKLSNSSYPDQYKPGDIVCWNLGGGINHIGLVTNIKSQDGKRFKIIHNIGAGQVIEDVLFEFKIIGHYRYEP